MIKEVKTYYSDAVPLDENLQECIRIAQTNDCFVSLVWAVYHSSYCVLIHPDDSLNHVKDKLPKV